MKRRLLYLCLAIWAALLFVSTAFAADGTENPNGAAAIQITGQRFTDDTRSFQVHLTGTELRGAVFIAVYGQDARMKYVEEYAATETVPVTLRNVLETDRVKAMWLDKHYMPLAQTEILKTVELAATSQDEFASAVLNMMRGYDGEVISQSNDEYAFARLIVRSEDALPDLDDYHIAQRISDTEGHTVLQFSSPDDARTCAAYLQSHISSNGYVASDTLESILEEPDNGSGAHASDSSYLSWGVPVIRADSYAAGLVSRGVNRQMTVAVVDTGVDYTHPFLENRTVPGYDFVDNDDNPMDEHYHGTHVAGTVADCTPGLTNLKIMPVRVLGASGTGTTLNVGLGIRYAADHGANVINLSLGGGHNSYKEESIEYAMSKNVVVVVAAGNSGCDAETHCPAHIRNCITVSAVDKELKPANFSNYGPAVDLGAPGVDIRSCSPGGGYRILSGTSMASPHVAACAAMLLEESPSLTPAQVEKKLVDTVQVPPGWNDEYGAGVVNMETAPPAGFYALLYTDGEMVFQNSATPEAGRALVHDPYPMSSVSGGASGDYVAWYDQRENIERVTFAEEVKPLSTALWFYGCTNLKSVQRVENLNTEKVADMSQMFARCDSLTALDLTALNTGNVTNTRQMFFQCGALRTIYASDAFNVSKVTDGSDMFTGCASLIGGAGTKPGPVDQTYARIDEGPSRPGYFTGEIAKYFYAILYKDGEMVFQNSATPDSNREPADAPFQINAADMPDYVAWYALRDQITSVTFAEEVRPVSTALWFYDCRNLKTIRNPENLKTDAVRNMSQMFSKCAGLETLDLRGFNTGNVTNTRQMFFQCGALKRVLVSAAFNMDKVTDDRDMFTGCVSLEGEKGTKYDSNHTDKAYARLDGGPDNPGYFSEKITDPQHGPSETLYAVLYDDGELKFQSAPDAESGKTPVKSYTTDSGGYDNRVESYTAWYEERTQIRSVNFAVALYPTSTALWFYDCPNLSSVENPGNLHTEYVTDMSNMFAYCSGLTSLDLSGFHTENLEDASMMFYRCESLVTIYASSSFTTDKIRDSMSMFGECVALKGGAGTSYSGERVDKTYARIDSASAAGYFTAK